MAASARFKYIYSQPDQCEWLFDFDREPVERHDLAAEREYQPQLTAMRSALIAHLADDGYCDPIDGDTWRQFPERALPDDPDAGLLYQAPSDLSQRLAEIAPYANPPARPAARKPVPHGRADLVAGGRG